MAAILSIIALGGFCLSAFLFIFFWSEDSKLERYYKQTAKNMEKSEPISKIGVPLKSEVIANTGHYYSRIRTVIKKAICRIFGHQVLDTVLIFNKNSTEQKAFLVLEAVKAALLHVELLDADFIEDLSKYHAFRYASEVQSVEQDVKFLLRKDFEKASNRDCITKLMDAKYSEKVVLNPPPEIKPLLEEIILPIVTQWSKELDEINASHAERERFKSLFMGFTKGLCQKTWGILFIGMLGSSEYLNFFSSGIRRFTDGVLLAGRGSHVTVLLDLWDRICNIAETQWNIKLYATDIIFQKVYPNGKFVLCLRKFVSKK